MVGLVLVVNQLFVMRQVKSGIFGPRQKSQSVATRHAIQKIKWPSGDACDDGQVALIMFLPSLEALFEQLQPVVVEWVVAHRLARGWVEVEKLLLLFLVLFLVLVSVGIVYMSPRQRRR